MNDTIKSFLVGLSFGVDDASLSKFNSAIKTASLRVVALYGAIKIAAAGIAYGFSKISEGFEQMGYEFRLVAPTINKVLLLRKEMLKAYSAAGINLREVVQQSIMLNFSLTKTKYALEAIYKSTAAKFFPLLMKQSDSFRRALYANMPKIQSALERFVTFVFKAFEATVILGERVWSILTRVYDFFAKLHDATSGWSTIIIGLIAAWNLLNLSFLATPLGMILTGLLAILALYDDFMTFVEGGKSLINWGPAIPIINAITDSVVGLAKALGAVASSALILIDVFTDLLTLNFEGLKKDFWSLAEKGNALMDIFMPHARGAAPPPLSGDTNNNSVSQKVNQQTNINVMGSADASSVGKAVAGEQSRVNFDMTRNMKGAVRAR